MSNEFRSPEKPRTSKKRGSQKLSLFPLDLERALLAAIATGAITDPAVKPAKKARKTKKTAKI